VTRVTTDDLVKAGYCARGLRRHYKAIGLTREDFVRFVREGLPVEEIEHVDDLMVQRVIEAARAREAASG
jgi:hypothetical protein